jgi:asparagine N-glycosylation enzyme membrane subunit Stt3
MAAGDSGIGSSADVQSRWLWVRSVVMRNSTSSVVRIWQKHPVVCSVLGVLFSVYVYFVIRTTADMGLAEFPKVLLMTIPVVLFFVWFSVFPFWASEHSFVWVFVVESLLFLAWGFVCVRRRYPLRVFALGLLAFAATNLTLNLVFPNWAD